jgi:hypothetical protein
MNTILIVICCLVAALLVFGLIFHDKLWGSRQRQRKIATSLILIDGGKAKWPRRA